MTLRSGIQNLISRTRATLAWNGSRTQTQTQTQATEVEDHAVSSGVHVEPVDLRPDPLPEIGAARRKIEEVASRLDEIDEHVGSHTAQTSRLGDQLEQLSRAVNGVSRIDQQCAQMMALLKEQVEKAPDAQLETDIKAVLERINEVAAKETTALELVQRKIDTTAEEVRGAAGNVEEILRRVSKTGEHVLKIGDYFAKIGKAVLDSQQAVNDLRQTGIDREARLNEMAQRWRKGLMMFVLGFGATSVVAVVIAVLALLK